MVPEQAVRRLCADTRQHPAQRVRAAAAQLFARGQQDVLRVRPGKRQEVHVHPGRVQGADRHVQLHRRRVYQHHGRVPVRVPQHGPAAQVQRAARQDHVHGHRRAEQLRAGRMQPHTGAVQLRQTVRGHTDAEQERDRAERRPDVLGAVRHGSVPSGLRGRRPAAAATGSGGRRGRGRRPDRVVRGTRRRADRVLHERDAGRRTGRRAAGRGLRERVAVAQGSAGRLRQLLAPDQPERAGRPADHGGRRRGAARTPAAHRQGQPPAHQPAGVREHAARRVRRVRPPVRQGRVGPQRARPVPVLLRHRHTRAGRRPVRPGAHVQGVPGGVRRAGRHAGRVVPHAAPVPAHRRGGRRRQDAVQAQEHENAVPAARPRAGQHRRPPAVHRRHGQHVPLRFAT